MHGIGYKTLFEALSTQSGTDLLTRHEYGLQHPTYVGLHVHQQAHFDALAVGSHEHALVQHHKSTAKASRKTCEMAALMVTQHSKGREVAWMTSQSAECKRADQSCGPAAWLSLCESSGRSWPSAGSP